MSLQLRSLPALLLAALLPLTGLAQRTATSGGRWALTPRNKLSGNGWLRLWVATRNRADKNVLRIGRKRKTAKTEFGTNTPPTLDSVREAAEQNVSWVPHGAPPNRPRPTEK